MRNKIKTIILICLLLLSSSFISYGIGGGGPTNKADIIIDKDDGLQYFTYKVDSVSSNSKYKYKTIGWDITFIPDGEKPKKTRRPYNFSNHGNDDVVKIPLEEIFNEISVDKDEKDRLKRKDGILIADAVQVILIDNQPMGENRKPVVNWNHDFNTVLRGNTQGIMIFKDDACSQVNPKRVGILDGLPGGIEWGPNTQKNLPLYYNQVANYDKLYSEIIVDLKIQATSSIDDHTIDMSKGEGSGQVRIHAKADITGFETNDIKMEPYLNKHSNIRQMVFTMNDGVNTYEKTITSFTELSGSTDFTFNYLPNDIEDGDADLDDNIIKDFHCDVSVDYFRQCHGISSDDTSVELIKKAPIPQGNPIAILSAPEEVLVGEEFLADGSGSLAPNGATIVDYKWKVETKSLPDQNGKKSITLTYDKPKTITIELTVKDSNGKTDTAMKDVIIKKKASPPVNWAPEVTLSAPNIVMQGDPFTLTVSAKDKEDGILTPTLCKPSCLQLSSPVTNGSNTAKFLQSGKYTVTAKATDSGGESDTTSVRIEVCPPKPLAIISEEGDYKVGQTVILDSSKSKSVSKTYPIDWKLTKWEITPLDNLTTEDIYYKKLNDREIAFTSKKTGVVTINLTVTNTLGYSNTRTIKRIIKPDTPPKSDFKLIKKVYRDKDNDKKAMVKAFDMSKSNDGDKITKRAWFYAFDSDNDGIFSDDIWYYHNGTNWVETGTTYNNLFTFADTVETGNLTDVTVETKHVGEYKFELKVYEEHDNRLLEFVDTSYILTDDTNDKPSKECISEVDNIAPVTAVKVDVLNDKVYDIVVFTDYKDMDLITLQTELNLLKAEAFSNNKNLRIHLITDKKKIGNQHKIKNYYTYARIINLSYYLESGMYEFSGPGGHTRTYYNHDPRHHSIHYETTQSFTTPTKPFEKGDKVVSERGSFYTSHDGQYGGYEKSGVEFRFYNPDNKIGTLVTYREETNGWIQGINWCCIYHDIEVSKETVNITNHWSRTSYYTPKDFYYDINAMDFSKIKDIPYTKDSKKVFLYFTKGKSFDYENEKGYNYSASSIDKDLMDYLISNNFETYVITSIQNILDKKFDSNNYNSDINSQFATLRELSHCSPIRGKYVIGDVNTDLWKDQLMHLAEKIVAMPNKIKVENNTIRLTFDKDFKEGEELDLTLLQQELKISDLVGNTIDLPKIKYKVKVEDKGIKELSSLCFSNPLTEYKQKENIEIVNITDEIIIYKENNQFKITIIDENKAKEKYGDNVIELKKLDFTNIKDVHILKNLIAILYNNGTVKSYGRAYYKLDHNKWRNIQKLVSSTEIIVAIKYDGSLMVLGGYSGYYYDTRYNNEEYKNNNTIYYDGIGLKNTVAILGRNKESKLESIQYGSSGVHFYPQAIKQKFYTTNFQLIGNKTCDKLIIKVRGNYYYSDDYELKNPIKELQGMNIKMIIPYSYRDFIAIKYDDTFYASESLRENKEYYSNVWYLNNLGRYKSYAIMENSIWIQGTNSECFLGNNGQKAYPSRYIKIDDIKNIIDNDYNNTYGNKMIIIMKNGKKYNMDSYMNAVNVSSSAKYYFADQKGIAYLNNNGYFSSSIVPYYYNWGDRYKFRNVTRSSVKKVITVSNSAILALDNNGTVSVYRYKKDDYLYYLDGAKYYKNVEDIFTSNGIVFLKTKDGVSAIYKSIPNNYSNYGKFRNKKITKYIIGRINGNYNNYLLGLDSEGKVWRTGTGNDLVLVSSNVKDMYNIENEIIFLETTGYLSKYGEGKKFELYEDMIITKKFITLKLKRRNEKACISKEGVQLGYIGKFKERLESVQYLNSTQFHIGKHLDDGVSFKYKIFTHNENSIEEILYHQEIDNTWKDVKDLDIIPVCDGYYIGVVEVNAENKAIRYSYAKATAENM
jgi:hypothetical protein